MGENSLHGPDGLHVRTVAPDTASGVWARWAGATGDAAFLVTRGGRFAAAYPDIESLAEHIPLESLGEV
ncbi:hypothetical protein [Actinocorallia longicatena]|uniref:Uncharacterized protein n=1 Tax=Actinocorallia longicatena TaxID=111803 RepID=A0ABP6Q7H0_9ACTN